MTGKDFQIAVESEFAFLRLNGFVVETSGKKDTPTGAGVTFVGKNVKVAVLMDRTEEDYIDCYVGAKEDGKSRRRLISLHGFLVRDRHYRGSFREFENNDSSLQPYLRSLRTYASAMKALAEDIVEDKPGVFAEDKAKQANQVMHPIEYKG